MGQEIIVKQHDAVTLQEIEALAPHYLIFSSGPRSQAKAGLTLEIIRHFAGKVPMLGVSLGHQLIVEAFGGVIVEAGRNMYGKTSTIHHDEKMIFAHLDQGFLAARYDSFVVDKQKIPICFNVSAESEKEEVMGIRHTTYPIEGVQFHPESLLTTTGKQLLKNFIIHYGG